MSMVDTKQILVDAFLTFKGWRNVKELQKFIKRIKIGSYI